ncbi:hypothetical protein EDB83DRAFT_2320211 [Lactarius deliciosus]|nr:hypothetical protein EDB83DRAFT_2320211 [Lactarius deliciosus]
MLPIHEVGTTAEIVALYHHSTAMKAAPSKQLDDPIPKIPLWEEPGTPPLESVYFHIWPHDMDTNYSESESDSLGSSEEWEEDSESGLDSVSSEDSDNDDMDREELKLMVDQANMLQKHVAEFQSADLHHRLAIVKDCLNWIQARWQLKASFKRRKRKLRQRAKKRSTLNLGRRWTHRDIDGLSQETKEKYRAQAKKWTEDIPPPQQQQKMMQKYGMSTFQEFTWYVYSQYGMWVAILGAYQDGEGDPSIMFFDMNEKLGGTSFKQLVLGKFSSVQFGPVWGQTRNQTI